MSNAIKVVVLGTGQMGTGIIKLLRQKQGIDLVGVYGRRARAAPTDVGDAIGLHESIGLEVSNDLTELLTRTRPRIAIQATCSRVPEAMDEVRLLLRHGINASPSPRKWLTRRAGGHDWRPRSTSSRSPTR